MSFHKFSCHTEVSNLTLRSYIKIHLLNLLDGSPHEAPLRKVIALDSGYDHGPRVINPQISSSRIALLVEPSSFTMERNDRELIVLDWKTGELVIDLYLQKTHFNATSTQVLKRSSDDKAIGNAISTITIMRFLEESWLFALYYEDPNPRLLVFNTLLPQQDPRSWRILGLPRLPAPQYCIQYEKVPTEYPEFSVDPAQRLFLVFPLDKRVLATPVELLIRRVHSVRVSPYISWDEWVEDFTEMHLHPNAHTIQLFDMKVLVLCGSVRNPKDWGVQMFDLSKSGRRDVEVQQVSEGAGGVCRRVLPAPKWFSRCQMGDGIPRSTRLVGNKVICFFVSPLRIQKCFCCIQRRAVQHQPSHPDTPYFLRVWIIS